jgi:raffinose/stachyose/melibiose transport system substrate-binding protein
MATPSRMIRRIAVVTALAAAPLHASAETTVRWFLSESNAAETAWERDLIKTYEASHPGTKIDLMVMSGEPYKAKLTTALQSPDRPHLFYTWGGGVMYAQADAGFLKDISAEMKGAWASSLSSAAVEGLTYKGKVYGAPTRLSVVSLWYNKELFAKIGLDPANLKTYDDLLAATKAFKAAGITPFAAGGSDKWPLNVFWECLALRIGGKEAFLSAFNRSGAGFDGPDYLKAAELFKQLIDLAPFQRGYAGMTNPQAAGLFGDGQAAMYLMLNVGQIIQRTQSANQKGLEDRLGMMDFPTIPGGKGNGANYIAGLNGFLVTKDAPPEALDFLRFLTNEANEREAAKRGYFIPATKGAETEMQNPYFKQLTVQLSGAAYLQNYYDQMLGPSVGRVVNDTSADLAAGRMTPKQVGVAIQEAWDLER